MRTKTLKEAELKFGSVVDNKWADEAKHMTVFKVPQEISQVLINSATGKPATSIYCNKELSSILSSAFSNVIDRKLISELKTFDGCFCVRSVRGHDGLSTHAYGLAIDLNKKENELGATPLFSAELVKCFTDAGFIWGGNFKRKDGMHFQYADW